jgi:hypothetical protein
MNLYLVALIAGALGLGSMAFGGLGRHGQGHGGGSHGHGGHGGHGHGGRGHVGPGAGAGARLTGWMLMSPRFLFAGLLGFGAIGLGLRDWIGGPVLLAAAVIGGIALERLVVAPLWNLALGFASRPAVTLESALTADATAVTSFDKNGQGIVSIEIDGQIQQILATLVASERALGATVRAGERVRIDDVDGARHRCTVSRI